MQDKEREIERIIEEIFSDVLNFFSKKSFVGMIKELCSCLTAIFLQH